jgi:hemolysin D
MRDATILDLADCTEYRHALRARPPAIVHGTLALLVALLGTALGWADLTRASLVVRGTGRIRPITTPVKVFNAARGDSLSASAGGRVAEINARVGDVVRRGDVLIRLETGRLDNEIARRARIIRAAEEELARLDRLDAIQARQYETARAKVEAELAQAREEVLRAKQRRDSEVRLAAIALEVAEREESRLPRLVKKGYVPKLELLRATTKTREAREKLAAARIPVDEGRVAVQRRALELVERDHAVKRDELELKRGIKRGEVEAARLELANLELEREQAVIRAPIDGVVTAGDLKVGDLLEPGKPAVEIARQAGFLFEAEVPNEEIGLVRPGMSARIKLDAYDYQRYGTLSGSVSFVSPDSGVSEGQAKDSYLVRVAVGRTELGRGGYRGQVKLGMTGKAEIIIGRDSLLSLLLRRIRRTISLG